MSIVDELSSLDDEDTGPKPKGSIVDEMEGLDKDPEAEAAEAATKEEAEKQLGQQFMMAFESKDPLAVYKAVTDIIANEG